jgi:GntR family transcriptional regulator
MKPGARVLEKRLIESDDELAKKLSMRPGEKVFKLQRVRLAEGEPLAIETTHLQYSLCKGIEDYDFSERSLYSTLRSSFNIELSRAEQSVEASLANEFEADNLLVDQGAPMLRTERTTFIGDEKTPIEYANSTYRGDRYRLFVELRG